MSDQVKGKTKRVIVWFVIGAHVVLILIPGIVFALMEWMKPEKPVVHKVTLTNKIPGSNQQSETNTTSEPDSGDLPDPPTDVSDVPEMPQPKPQPPQPKPQPPQPKPQPPQPTPKPKPKPKTPPKKVTPVQKRPTAEDIRKKIQRNPNRNKTAKVNPSPRQPKNINISRNPGSRKNYLSDLASDIKDSARQGSSGNSINTGAALSYYDSVGSFLERLWERDRPNSAAIGGRKPVVVVEFTVAPGGSIISKRIIRKSGVRVVDASVERLLARISSLPQPPQGIKRFTVNMRVKD